MNITPAQLEAEYEQAIVRWPFLHDLEHSAGLPVFLLAAVGSRETNLDPSFTEGKTGDHGHGHGVMQRDDRWHDIPPGFDLDARAQFTTGAEQLRVLIDSESGELLGALNQYNSGSSLTADTTGGDYGPDVLDRLAHLVQRYSTTTTTHKENPVMFTYSVNFGPEGGRIYLMIAGRAPIWLHDGTDVDRLRASGVPEVGELTKVLHDALSA